jgi:hypothetical protein
MPSPNAYRPGIGSVLTIAAGVWSASGRPTVNVTVQFDARLLMDFVDLASKNPTNVATIGLGNPKATVTLTP